MNEVIKIVFCLLCLIQLNSCGTDTEAAAVDDNECERRWIGGQECIVCSKGGVSCRWD